MSCHIKLFWVGEALCYSRVVYRVHANVRKSWWEYEILVNTHLKYWVASFTQFTTQWHIPANLIIDIFYYTITRANNLMSGYLVWQCTLKHSSTNINNLKLSSLLKYSNEQLLCYWVSQSTHTSMKVCLQARGILDDFIWELSQIHGTGVAYINRGRF